MKRAPLELDFVAAPRRPRLAGLIVMVAALGVAGTLLHKSQSAQQRLQQLQAAENLLGGARAPRAVPRERLDEQLKSAQATVRQLALPWAELIDALERSAMREVSLLHIQPDAQQRLVRLTAEARNEGQMLEYLRRVGAVGGLSEVHLLSHQVREEAPLRPLQFSLQASFRAGP
jgi:hypothetical protein